MGLRLKFLFILLIFSIVPLLTLYWFNQRILSNLGDEVYRIAKVLLLQTAAKEIQDAAENYSTNLKREFRYIDTLVAHCRDSIEDTLVTKPSLSPQGQEHIASATIAAELSVCAEMIREVRDNLVTLQIYTGNDILASYPETTVAQPSDFPKSDIPDASIEKTIWSFPDDQSKSAGTGQWFTVTLPIHYETGIAQGVLLAKFDFIQLLEEIRPKTQWTSYLVSLLMRIDLTKSSQKIEPLIIGIRKPTDTVENWQAVTTPLLLQDSADVTLQPLFHSMPYGKEGYTLYPYENEDAVWSYAEIGKGLAIVNILPEREILYLIARHPGRLSRWLGLDSLLVVSVVVLIMVIIVSYRSRRMLAPFFSLVSAFRDISAGDFSTRVEFSAQDERQMVAEAFNSMASQLESSMRLRQSMEVAEEIQHNFLPEVEVGNNELDIDAVISYCEETGGDYIDILDGNDGKVDIIVADVTGHGIGAALLMATIRALIRGHRRTDSNLKSLITAVNHSLYNDMKGSGRFVTLFILEVDQPGRRLSWVRAGHDPAWYFSNSSGESVALDGQGIALGVVDGVEYSENCLETLAPGDVILIGTDGIWETEAPDGTFFGKKRLERVVRDNMDKSAAQINTAIIAEVDRFRGNNKQEDDISSVVIKILG